MLTSRFVVPVDGPVIRDGGVVLAEDRIVAVGPAHTLHSDSVIDFGHAVILPAFVNAHTHLELSDLAGLVPPSPRFTDWLQRLIAVLRDAPLTRTTAQQAARRGLAQSLAAGVATVGDISRAIRGTRAALAESVLRATSFGEVIAIGARRDALVECLDAASNTELQSDRLRVGISPHAPYTVEPEAMRACADRAHEQNARLCIHLAETADEDEFVRTRGGALADHLRAVGAWDDEIPVSGCGPVELASRTGVLGPKTIVAHGNYVTDADIRLIAKSGASVAYCPRTHHAFSHVPHRFADMLVAGINVCIGTDSLASNPSLSILEELRFLRNTYPDLSSDTITAMGTIHGARALGFDEVTGSITVGKCADLVIVPLESAASTKSWESVLESDQQPLEVYVSGVPQLRRRGLPDDVP